MLSARRRPGRSGGLRSCSAAGKLAVIRYPARGTFAAFKGMRKNGLDVLAVYHSHPTTAPVPSRKDVDRNYSEDLMSLIISLAGSGPIMRGWWPASTEYQGPDWSVIG